MASQTTDPIGSQTVDQVARQLWSVDALGRFGSYTSEAWSNGAWQQAVTKVNHYDSDSDSPAWIAEDSTLPDELTRFVDGLDGNLAVQTGKTGNRVVQLVDLHGDVMGTLPVPDGAGEADWTGLKFQTADEFGNPTDLTTGGARVTTGAPPGRDGRYGWLGGKQRSADALAGVLLMGVRLYDPATGRFWSTDPQPGGNGTTYDYCTGDPVNCTDLDGNSFWSSVRKGLKVIAKVAEVASFIPGPIGAAAAAISAAAYAATGNKRAAVFMAATVGAALVGAGAAVAAAKWGGAAAKVGLAAAKVTRAGSQARVNSGIYVVATRSGLPYVGRSFNIDRRLAQHVAAGKITSKAAQEARRIPVQGGLRQQRIAEQKVINQHGGISNLANRRNEIARKYWGKHGIR